jgi:nitrogen-specific signal transduction histidine kinase/ActR/RegA family two-component response regulator
MEGKMNKSSIKNNMIKKFTIATITIVAVFFTYVLIQVYKAETDLTYQVLEELTAKSAKQIELDFSNCFTYLKAIKHNIELGVLQNRQYAVNYIREMTIQNNDIQGLFLMYEENAFDGRDSFYKGDSLLASNKYGHFTPWWYRENANIYQGKAGRLYFDDAYYANTKTANSKQISDPYIDKDIGVLMATLTYPIYKDDIFVAVLGLDLTLEYLHDMVSNIKILDSGYSFLISSDGQFISFPVRDFIGKKTIHEYAEESDNNVLSKIANLSASKNLGMILGKDLFEKKKSIYLYTSIGDTYWTLVTVVPKHEVLLSLYKLMFGMLIIAIASLIIYIYLAKYISETITKPIVSLSKISNKIAYDRDYSIRLETDLYDEIGQLYQVFNFMLHNIQEKDIERDSIEKELLMIKNFLVNVIQSMPSILISFDNEGIIGQWNKSAEKYFNIPEKQAVGKHISECLQAFTRYIEEFKQDYTAKHYDSEQIEDKVLNIHIYHVSNEGSDSCVLLIEDISELKQKDMQLQQAQKMETIGNLAGGIAHDFNNILASIIGTVSILKFNINKNMGIAEHQLNDYLQLIEDSSNRAADIVQQLLSLSKKHDLTLNLLDLNRIIDQVYKISQNTFDKSINFIISPYQCPAIAKVSGAHIEQAILNLCINAAHAMTFMRKDKSKIGGILTLSISLIKVDNFFMQTHPEAVEHEYWRILVGDTGDGMDSKTQSKIFEPFFSTKGKNAGTGLGLTMVYNIIKHHNGFIDVYSELNLGTNMYIYLPVNYHQDEAEIVKTMDNIYKGEGTILVVDDEPLVRRISSEMLTAMGYKVMTANNGEEAINIYKDNAQDIDMIILDMVMPKKSGKDAYMEIRKINPEVKVILSSGFKQDDRVQKVLDLGIKVFLQKPFTLEKLSKAVYELLKDET